MQTKYGIRIYLIIQLTMLLSFNVIMAQVSNGKVIYERKTNLHKKFKNSIAIDWIKEEDKLKTDVFELYFNDTLSVFKPQVSELKENYSWTTSKNIVYQNFTTKTKFTIKTIWSELLYIQDSLSIRKWQITDSRRNIAGFSCRKAIWKINDSTKIYAWYCDEIMVSSGPESFNGLPGLILGLATEDGGVIYFAKQVELTKQNPVVFVREKTKEKIYGTLELKKKLEKDFGNEKWGKTMIAENFGIW